MRHVHTVVLIMFVMLAPILAPLVVVAQDYGFSSFIVKRVCLEKRTPERASEWVCVHGNSGHFSEPNLNPRARWDDELKRFRFGYGLEFRVPQTNPMQPYGTLLYPIQTSTGDTFTGIRVEFATEFYSKLLRVSITNGFGPPVEDWQNIQGPCGCNDPKPECQGRYWEWREQQFAKSFSKSHSLLAPSVVIYVGANAVGCIY